MLEDTLVDLIDDVDHKERASLDLLLAVLDPVMGSRMVSPAEELTDLLVAQDRVHLHQVGRDLPWLTA